MRVTMRNWQPAAGSRYQDQTRTAAPGSEAERASGIPVQTETAADRYLSTKDTAQDDFYQSIRGQVQDQTSFLNSLLGEDPEDFLASLLGKDEKSLLDSMLGKDKEEDSFLASLLGQAKESSNFKMSVSMPEDSVGQLATELARSETKMNVLQVSSKALRALGTLKIAYALSEGDDKEKIGRMIRRMQKLTRQIQKKIKNLSKEEQLQLQRKRAEERQQQEKEMEIRKEISKRKRKRRREENHYASKEVMQDRKEALQETLDSIAGLGSSSAAAAAAEGLVSRGSSGSRERRCFRRNLRSGGRRRRNGWNRLHGCGSSRCCSGCRGVTNAEKRTRDLRQPVTVIRCAGCLFALPDYRMIKDSLSYFNFVSRKLLSFPSLYLTSV